MNTPTKLLGIYVPYDERGNNQMNFNLKVQKLQTNLDIWKSRGLTLYGKVLIIKSLGLSSLIYPISNVKVPKEIVSMVKDKMFRLLWKNKKDKIKRIGMYQDLSREVYGWLTSNLQLHRLDLRGSKDFFSEITAIGK